MDSFHTSSAHVDRTGALELECDGNGTPTPSIEELDRRRLALGAAILALRAKLQVRESRLL